MKQKILVILDCSYKNSNVYDRVVNQIQCIYGIDYDVVFKLFNPVQTKYEYIPQNIQSDIDTDTVQAYIDNYVCVIVSGPASYFWLQSFYDGKLIAINPVIDIYENYPYDEYKDDDLRLSRSFRSENIICIVSDEKKDYVQEYDNNFFDTTVVVAKEKLKDIKSFWSIGSTFDKVFKYMVDNQ